MLWCCRDNGQELAAAECVLGSVCSGGSCLVCPSVASCLCCCACLAMLLVIGSLFIPVHLCPWGSVPGPECPLVCLFLSSGCVLFSTSVQARGCICVRVAWEDLTRTVGWEAVQWQPYCRRVGWFVGKRPPPASGFRSRMQGPASDSASGGGR